MRYVILLSFFCFSSTMFSQFPGAGFGNASKKLKGKIIGVIQDSVSGNSIGYATVVLKKAGKEKEKDGVLSEESGKFKFSNVKEGNYDLFISFLGFKDKKIENVELTAKKPDINLGVVLLTSENFILDEIEIKEKRALVEMKVDKIVFNAEDDSSITGGDASDVLRKVPTLSVDLEGNVSIRGSQNLRILINGKPSGMFSSNVANALKMFPADQIKSVEVITSPSAKYDSEGGAGIINIITKKSNIEGLAGSIDASIGTRQNSLTGNLSAGKGRFGSSLSGNGFYSFPTNSTNDYVRTIDYQDGSKGVYSSKSFARANWLGWNGSASAFYDFNAYNAINATLSFRGFGNVSDSIAGKPSVSTLIDPVFDYNNDIERYTNSAFTQGGYDASFDYTRKFESDDDRQLVLAGQISGELQNNNYEVRELLLINGLQTIQERAFDNEATNTEYTLQADYTLPLPKSIKLEVGAKGVLRQLGSSFNADFKYGQQVLASYSQVSFVIKKFQFTTGLRYENTQILGIEEVVSEVPGFEDATCDFNYHNVFPNLSISRSLKNFNSLKLSYTQRIQRPSLYFLNPFTNVADNFNTVSGNPILCPELVDQIEFSYNTFLKGFGVFSSVFYKYSRDPIEAFVYVNQVTSSTNYINIENNQSVGLNIFTTKNVNKFTIRGGGNIYTYNGSGTIEGLKRERSAFLYDIFASGDYAITATIKADLFAFFKSPVQTLQGYTPSFWMTGIGIKKEFKKSSFGIRIIDPFNRIKNFGSEIGFINDEEPAWTTQEGNPYTVKNDYSIPFRSIGVSYKYKFGKVDFKERKSKIKNDDLKQENSGGQGGGGGTFGG